MCVCVCAFRVLRLWECGVVILWVCGFGLVFCEFMGYCLFVCGVCSRDCVCDCMVAGLVGLLLLVR